VKGSGRVDVDRRQGSRRSGKDQQAGEDKSANGKATVVHGQIPNRELESSWAVAQSKAGRDPG
jgi:hypothetical protein